MRLALWWADQPRGMDPRSDSSNPARQAAIIPASRDFPFEATIDSNASKSSALSSSGM